MLLGHLVDLVLVLSSLFFDLLLLLLVEFLEVFHLFFFELNSVLLVLHHHSLELLVHREFLELLDSFSCSLCLVVSRLLDTSLLVLSQRLTKPKIGEYQRNNNEIAASQPSPSRSQTYKNSAIF